MWKYLAVAGIFICLIVGVGHTASQFQFNPLNINGDTAYVFGKSELRMGVGIDLAKFDEAGAWNLRVEALKNINNDEFGLVGAGVNCKLAKIFKKNWLLDKLNSGVFALGLVDLNDEMKPYFALGVEVVRFEF